MGKTRTGAETVRGWEEEASQRGERITIALVGQNSADVRDVMILGESGILSISPPWNRPTYIAARRMLLWPSGSQALIFFGDTPDQLRGPQFHFAWVDEIAKFRYPLQTWDNLELALRLGDNPRAIVTTTPRPIPILRSMLEDPMVAKTFGSSYENLANLAPTYITRVIQRYEGTRTGRQELHGEMLTDMPGALWTFDMIENNRVSVIPDMKRIVIAVDPAVTAHEESDESGIVVCGLGMDDLGYVLEDASGRYTPDGWAQKVVNLYAKWKADRVVAEVNNGGDLVETVLRTVDRNLPVRKVRASRGKTRRAEPVAALYEQNKVKHFGMFSVMEDQMTTYVDDSSNSTGVKQSAMPSPDRMDAMVWGITSLMLNRGQGARRRSPTKAIRTF